MLPNILPSIGALKRSSFSNPCLGPFIRNFVGTFGNPKWLPGLRSQTFSADQLWFRILSGLFQRCSLPENLWTALIQLWTALKTEIFRAKNQQWNSAVSVLFFYETALIQSWTALISSETALNSADFWIMQNGKFWIIFHFFPMFVQVPQFRGTKCWLSAQLTKRSEQQKFTSLFSYIPKILHLLDVLGLLLLLK